MASVTPILDQNFDVDKLTYEIFSLLENKFLFGCQESNGNGVPLEKSDISNATLFNDLKSNKNVTGKVRILSIDSNGSTDGVLAARTLVHLEERLCQESGNPNAKIADYFDVAAGSGVGGILAALLFTKGNDGRPIYKAKEALNFLVKNRRKLFPSSSSNGIIRKLFHSSSKGEKIFRQVFGESTLKDTLKPVLIPCYDLSTRAPFLFSRADAFESDGYDFKISDICAATSADPTMVGAFEMKSVDKRTKIIAIDGGVAMNNPTAAAITHVLNNKHEFPFCNGVEDLLVVSLGNGVSNPDCSAPNLVQISGEGASDMIDEAVSKAFGESMTSNYVRIQGNGFDAKKCFKKSMHSSTNDKKLLAIVEAMLTQKNVESVLFRGKKVVEKRNSDKLESFAGELVKEHERRKLSILPTVVFKQNSPRTSSATVSTVSSY
ncbi:Patatin-like protein [Thalictrum thalictroides]|uniref:Patatin n=1 Tax=Thalictrum thalictroides TaxID=46969 RepID=A0A7J6VG43_THATH|nr:Patatin-like protein [Thalictrum thalictroides]